MTEYVPFALARAAQAENLENAMTAIATRVREQQAAGAFRGAGPIFLGIGASLAAACAPVWAMRSRGIHSWRLGAGDFPLPFPASVHPVVAISQSGRSAETLAALKSVPPARRYAVVNTDPSPISSAAGDRLSLGDLADSYASTIGYTATVAGLGMLADVWDGGHVDPSWSVLPGHLAALERDMLTKAGDIAALIFSALSADFVGAGPSVGSAEAGALLFREVARVPSAAMSTRQYLHGAMESAGESILVLFGDDRELEIAATLSDRGSPVLLVTAETVPDTECLRSVTLPVVSPSQRAILEAVVMQTVVQSVAEMRGVEIEDFVFHHSDTKVDGSA